MSDPYGMRFAQRAAGASGSTGKLAALAVRWLPQVRRWILYMQVRTRVIDDVLCDFVDGGGRQIVILGAGYDCRAHRFAARLEDCRVFEIDHPATQRRKRRVLGAEGDVSHVRYLPWNFESQTLLDLPTALADLGHRRLAPTLTIWEGVTMYLTESAIDESVTTIRDLSGAGSRMVFTYFDRASVHSRSSVSTQLTRAFVSRVGEPWRWGWAPEELEGWMATRSVPLLRNVSIRDEAARLLPAQWAMEVNQTEGRLALVALEHLAVTGS
jgi:methyltransferase (TIGR00027 family)